MKQRYEDYLFSKGYLVAQGQGEERHPAEALVALGRLFAIRITKDPGLADVHMVEVASRNLGINVPEPFYRGFPETVLELSPVGLLLDQLIHYTITYGMGDFSQPGHSLFEREYERTAFEEDVDPKPFAILTEDEADRVLANAVSQLLSSTRPLAEHQYELVRDFLADYSLPMETCANKDTAARLILDVRDPGLARLIILPDVIRLVEWMAYLGYGQENIRKLNLRNRDRKLLTAVLDCIFERGNCDTRTCLEKRRRWNGLLHHLHYKPRTDEAQEFLAAIRSEHRTPRSAYSDFEYRLGSGDPLGAARCLRDAKGAGAVLRNLALLANRCKSEEEVRELLEIAASDNKVILIQLIQRFGYDRRQTRRIFAFTRFGKLAHHTESKREAARRTTVLSSETAQLICWYLLGRLRDCCRGTLGKVFVDPDMRGIAPPLKEATSMGGYGSLPSGSRRKLPAGKIIRAFTYWEKVDDIDLSCIGFSEDGEQREFSWRTMNMGRQSMAVTYSGDVTSGYRGGSEYFDVNTAAFKTLYPDCRYIAFCDNVFTRHVTFSNCLCKAGYMVRDTPSTGRVFEPKSVKTSYVVNGDSNFVILFALDLETSDFVWLNIIDAADVNVSGTVDLSFLLSYLHAVDIIDLYEIAKMLATEVVDDPYEADVVFSDDDWELDEGQEWIRSCDYERVMQLLNS